jgi:uncharacterized protein (TIRG00374 family)
MPAWVPQALGYTLSAVCLIWVLRGYPFDELIPAIRSLDWRWVAIGIVADLAVYLCHAWRWNTLLSPVARLGYWRTVQSIYIGLFANEVLPLRVGELIRCYLLAHWNGLRLSLGFASAAVERVIDGFWMLGAFLITASFVKGIPRDVTILVQIMGVALLISAAVLMWIVLRKQHAAAVIRESRWSSVLRHVIEGLQLMGKLKSLSATVAISLLYLLLHMFSYYALMRAYGLDLSFWAAAGVVVIVRLLTVVPNAPGNLGLGNAACVMAMRLFEVEPNDAKTFSIILFCALTLPLLIGGAVATAMTGLNIGELRDRARQGMDPSLATPAPEKS